MHTRLDRAQAALDDAQTRIGAALGAEGLTEDLRIALSQAQALLSTAQIALVPVLRDELAQAERDAAEQRARADTYDPRISLTDAVTPSRRAGIRLPERLIDKGSSEADAEGPAVSWTARTRTDGAHRRPPTQRHQDRRPSPGRTARRWGWASGQGTLVSTDEFTLRGITMRGGGLGKQSATGGWLANADGANPPILGIADSGWRNWNAAYESSIQMKADGSGITLKMGGDGTIFYDFERLTALGREATLNQPDGVTPPCAASATSVCDDVIASDVKATFGTPLADPDGEASWHFKMRVPVNPDAPHVDTRTYADLPSGSKFVDDEGKTLYRVADANGRYKDKTGTYRVERAVLGSGDVGANWERLESRRAQRIDRGRPSEELGVYNVYLSKLRRRGRQGHRHRSERRHDALPLLCRLRPVQLPGLLDQGMNYARVQAFHFGYDAFSDADDNRPADWGTSAAPITATFNGRTTGWMIRGTLEEAGRINELIRLRGDVKLTATLNAGGANNQGTVTGSMNNFEFLRKGIWSTDVNFRMLLNDTSHDDDAAVVLQSADIEADGSFSGAAAATVNGTSGSGADNFNNGTYGGAFYGPRVLGIARGRRRMESADERRGRQIRNPGRGAIIGSLRRQERVAVGVRRACRSRTRRVPPGGRGGFFPGASYPGRSFFIVVSVFPLALRVVPFIFTPVGEVHPA